MKNRCFCQIINLKNRLLNLEHILAMIHILIEAIKYFWPWNVLIKVKVFNNLRNTLKNIIVIKSVLNVFMFFCSLGGGLLCLLLPNTTREPLSWPRLFWLAKAKTSFSSCVFHLYSCLYLYITALSRAKECLNTLSLAIT